MLSYAVLWDSTLEIPWPAVGYLVLVAAAFAALQGAVLRLLGLAGAPLLALLYLTVPAVAALPPELLQPAYRVLLWSWSPFRFSTETLRSLLFLDGPTPGVGTGIVLFALLAAGGLAVLLWPSRPPQPDVVQPAEQPAMTSEENRRERQRPAVYR